MSLSRPTFRALLFLMLFCLTALRGMGQNPGNYTFQANGNELTITRFSTSYQGSVDIPESYQGRTVTAIAPGAFKACYWITSVTMPNTVRTIGDEAFSSCTRLASLQLSSGVTTIGTGAFVGCSELASLDLPASLTSLGAVPFGACPMLAQVNVDPANPAYASVGGVVYNKALTEMIQCPGGKVGELVVPATVQSIPASGAIGAAKLTRVVLPEGLTTMGNLAFGYCNLLQDVELPSTLEEIPTSAFHGCSSLVSVLIPQGVLRIGDGAFTSCTSLPGIDLPVGLTSIGKRVFQKCSSLASVSIASTVTSIGEYAFAECPLLTSVVLPDALAQLGDAPFSGSNVASYSLDAANPNFKIVDGYLCSADGTQLIVSPVSKSGVANLPSAITSIAKGAFANCRQLTSLVLPGSVVNLGEAAFQDCTGLVSLTIRSTLTSQFTLAFAGCTGLTDITVAPEGADPAVASMAFYRFTPLQRVTVLPGMVTIGNSAFQNCSSLLSVSIPPSVTAIGGSAFSGCVALGNTALPSSLTFLGGSAFSGCHAITSMTIPSGITVIPSGLFGGCINLSSVSLPSGTVTISGFAFDGCRSLASVNLPAGITTIENHAFIWCSGLTSFVFPSGVTAISNGVLWGCTSLVSVSIPAGVTTIGTNSFLDCTALKEVNFAGNSVTTISQMAFKGCGKLTSLDLPDGIFSIGGEAFADCVGLAELELPTGLYIIGDALKGCTSLRELTMGTRATQNPNSPNLFGGSSINLRHLSIKPTPGYTQVGNPFPLTLWKFTSLEILEGVTGFDGAAFMGASELRWVMLPASVQTIGSMVFNTNVVERMIFRGNAPANVAGWTGGITKVYHFGNATGFTSPTWKGLTTVNMGTANPEMNWKLEHQLPHDVTWTADPNGDGVNLLMAYALKLDPHQDLSGSLPKPVLSQNEMSLKYHAGTPGVTYEVLTSTDMVEWDNAGITFSGLDAQQFRTATVSRDEPAKFMRLNVYLLVP